MKFKFLALTIIAFAFASCGGNSSNSEKASESETAQKEHVVKPTQTEIKGDLKGYFETVDKETPITKDMSANVISVEIKRTEKELPFDRKDVTIFPEADDSEKSYGYIQL